MSQRLLKAANSCSLEAVCINANIRVFGKSTNTPIEQLALSRSRLNGCDCFALSVQGIIHARRLERSGAPDVRGELQALDIRIASAPDIQTPSFRNEFM